MEISILTGLPELPEGQLWRVTAKRGSSFSMFGVTESYGYVTIVQKSEVHSTRDREIALPWPFIGASFTWGTESYSEVKEEELISMAIIKTAIKPTDVYDEDSLEKIGVRDEEIEERVSIDDLTPELILETAKRALARLHEINISHEFIGDYPPKKLEI